MLLNWFVLNIYSYITQTLYSPVNKKPEQFLSIDIKAEKGNKPGFGFRSKVYTRT